ncbi:ABC transporter ATP-binding protein [Pseudochelatococcus contaminans]|uniref:Branched-chain amino acid transport system ATP-binding protein n=1 Tax=Pseudochelatococcus contaminans TaxID=1538103 RepID=A0A7W6EG75_9HYPH|nr:ABC transporter ATP-binding protein [Pseudochelatococcus contaminans]MBB3809271.1 branched-chain amino acid transport system ATP-binding protein [Pseudochelatococcus contaminans]
MSNTSSYIEIKDLVVKYGKVEALHGISLNVKKGEIVTILGANGAGKTTLLASISGLIRPSSGTILFDGQPIQNIDSAEIVKRGIIQSPEGRRVFSTLTVWENLLLGAYTNHDKQKEKDILEWVFTLFPRLKERLKQLAGTLSGGEQQMLAIGRSLMGDPKLLLLDEPSLGLAPLVVRQILAAAKEINERGVTVMLVEQNAVAALKIANRGYVIEVGRIVMDGEAHALMHNPEIQKAYLGG